MNKLILSLLTFGLILVNQSPILSHNDSDKITYNCLTREVWTPEKQAWCDKVKVIDNTEYNIPDYGLIKLNNGFYEKDDPESGTRFNVGVLHEFITFADVNNDGKEEGLSLLWLNSEGSGVFTYLIIVSDTGENLATEFLGDRIKAKSLSVTQNNISINLITQAPEEPFCCPTLEVINTYKLNQNKLELISQEKIKPEIKDNYTEINLTDLETSLTGNDLEAIALNVFPFEKVSEGNFQQEITINNDNPNLPILTITRINLPDDSILGMRYLLEFEPNTNGSEKWRLIWAGFQQKCRENRGSQDWTQELCL